MNPIKAMVGRLLGYQKTIRELEVKIEELSWDTTFGMWTRGAFLQFCRVMPRGKRIVVFIDLDDIHVKNIRWGYTEVDRRIRAAFSIPLRRSDIVSRWYSGDEIVILFDSDSDEEGAARKLSDLEESATRWDISFQHEVGTWDVGRESIVALVDRLAERNRKRALRRSEKERKGDGDG